MVVLRLQIRHSSGKQQPYGGGGNDASHVRITGRVEAQGSLIRKHIQNWREKKRPCNMGSAKDKDTRPLEIVYLVFHVELHHSLF